MPKHTRCSFKIKTLYVISSETKDPIVKRDSATTLIMINLDIRWGTWCYALYCHFIFTFARFAFFSNISILIISKIYWSLQHLENCNNHTYHSIQVQKRNINFHTIAFATEFSLMLPKMPHIHFLNVKTKLHFL